MRTRHDLPRPVREIENVFIPMPDGARLAARLWLPEGAEREPVPAVLEYIPYRKRDFTRGRDEPMHRWFAGHGIATVRVDLRGCGDSDGLLLDEYLPTEQEDGVEVIRWVAAQPWCDGAVGMMGISWGGFNALQVAALRPPALRAVITLCASDDRYADDAHYMGGAPLTENLIWGSVLMAFQSLPPDPEIVGERWETMWRERLEALRPFPADWLRHPRRDAYWRQGSVCQDYSRIQVPVLAIGGWADGYSNAVPRLLAGLPGPRKGLVGPWSHAFPHDARPGPRIGFLQEALRWWDRWLRGEDNGVMDEPGYRVWMQESVPPAPDYDARPGRWVAEESWPSQRIEPRLWLLGDGTLSAGPAGNVLHDGTPEHATRHPDPHPQSPPPEGAGPAGSSARILASPPFTGLSGGDWCAFGVDGELPADQRGDDGRSVVYDSAPLRERLEILGAPEVELTVESDRPVAQLAVRLNDVAPDGASLRVTYGVLNLTHRRSHAEPEPLVPGEPVRVRVALNHIAHAFPPGHRIRLALSSVYWPIVLPPPGRPKLRLHPGGALTLPVRPPRPEDEELTPFQPPEAAAPPEHRVLHPTSYRRVVERDLAAREVSYTVRGDGGDFDGAAIAHLPDIGLDIGYTTERRFTVRQDGSRSHARIAQRALLRRPGWEVEVTVETDTEVDAERTRFTAAVVARQNDRNFARRTFDEVIPRDLW